MYVSIACVPFSAIEWNLNGSLDRTLACGTAIAAIGSILDDAELLSLSGHTSRGGMLSPAGRIYRLLSGSRRTRFVTPLFHGKPFASLVLIRIAIMTICLFLAAAGFETSIALTAYTILTLFFSARGGLGNNGSDQMLHVVLLATWIAVCSHNETVKRLAVFFIATQLSLSYLTAGAVKLISPGWRNGSHLRRIVRSMTFGHPFAVYLESKFPYAFNVMTRVGLVWEFAIAVGIWMPPKLCAVLLSIGVAFHVSVAILMGLNTFLPAFLAAYPSALYVSHRLWRGSH